MTKKHNKVKKIFYILLITQITVGLSYSQSGWVKQNFNTTLELDGLYFTNENTGYMGASSLDSSRVYKTTNAGVNWIPVFSNGMGGFISVFFSNNNTGFATFKGVVKTTNSGINWTVVYIASSVLFSIVFSSPDTGYACGKWTTMLKTTNGGDNWFTLSILGGMYQDLYFVNNNTGFTVSEFDYVMKTTNGGVNWIRKDVGNNSRLYGVTFLNSNTGFCGGYDGGSICAFKTTNSGENWTEILYGQQGYINKIKFINNQTGYIAGTYIIKTTNSGESWQTQMDVGYGELYSIFFVNQLTGYACGVDYSNHKGILYKTTTGGEPIGIQPISTEIPDHYTLYQNYPNPFNPVTKVRFSIPPSKGVRGMIVRLTIYDLLGREVAVLVDEQLTPGSYEVRWDASNYASGIYFYRLSISDASTPLSITKKMVLLK